jgi:hypothetical protein
MQTVQNYMASWEGITPSLTVGVRTGRASSATPEHYLFVGQNAWLPGLIQELSAVVPAHSTGTLLVHAHEDVQRLPVFAGNNVDIVVRSILNEPLDSDEFISKFDHVIVLADHNVDDEESDSKVLTDVLACRVHLETRQNSFQPVTVVAELRQRASKHIAAVRMADDLLVSEALTACAMAQFALYPENNHVLRHLLGAESPVFLYSIPVHQITNRSEAVTWEQLREELRRTTGEIAIAARFINTAIGTPYVEMNPKGELTLLPDDDVIVLTRLYSENPSSE